MKPTTYSILFRTLAAAAVLLAAACHRDPTPDAKRAGDRVVFGATVREADEVRTRGVEGLDSVYINADKFNVDFYIELCSEKEGQPTHTQLSTYTIPSGFEGRLEAKSDEDALNWHELDSRHTFYAWTVPWIENWTPSAEPLEITFYNSSEADGFAQHNNNAILEKFIGAKSDTFTYIEHGKYVDLTFYHLVSKIRIGSLKLIKTDGSIQENLKADVTFVGMPTAATFRPHPETGRPCITDQVTDPDKGVTYFIDNDATTEDVFYICPEIDFSKIDFKVKLNSADYVNFDTYYGTFDDVKFERKPGTAHDWNNGRDDSKILHAGEMMTLNLVLIPGIGPGLSIVISDWSTDEPKESEYHSNPGIYSDAELSDILDTFRNQRAPYDPAPDDLKWLFELYGKEEDGKQYFPLYDNVTNDSNIFPVHRDYIVDGMGHTVYMKTNYGYNGDFGGSKTYYNIGPAVDIWLSDMNGNNTIYIDREGYVWYYDEDGNFQRGEQLPPLDGDYKSYDISIDGKVHRSTYFNNQITGS